VTDADGLQLEHVSIIEYETGEKEWSLLLQCLLGWVDHQSAMDLPLARKIKWITYNDDDEIDTLTDTQLMERVACERCGFIFAMYHANAWYYEIFDLARKLVMTGLLVFVERGNHAQVAIGLVVCFAVFSINLSLSPIYKREVDRVQNIAMLELVVTLFLGLLLKLEVVNAGEEHSGLFSGIIALMTAFIFIYPVISMILTSERMRNSFLSRLTRCIAPSLTFAARARGGDNKPQSGSTAATKESGAEHGAARDADMSAGARRNNPARPAQLHSAAEAGPSSRGPATSTSSAPAAAHDSHAINIESTDEDDTGMIGHAAEQDDEHGAQ